MSWRLHLLKFNNYYNRQLKRLNTLDEYEKYEIAPIDYAVNFNIRNGIENEITINNWEYNIPDYVIVENDTNETFTRWYVIETKLITDKQFKLILKRDLLAENILTVLNSDCLIEKASNALEMINFPDAWNKEQFNVNQIKINEFSLKDENQIPYIVIYLAKNIKLESYTYTADRSFDYAVHTLDDFEFKDLILTNKYFPKDTIFTIYYKSGSQVRKFDFNVNGYFKTSVLQSTDRNITLNAPTSYYECNYYDIKDKLISLLKQYYCNYNSEYEDFNNMINLDGKQVLVGESGTLYSLELIKETGTTIAVSENDFNIMYEIAKNLGLTYTAESNDNFEIKDECDVQIINTIDISLFEMSVEFATTVYNTTGQNLYNIIAIPYGNISNTGNESKTNAINFVNSLIAKYGSEAIYDVQLVPYVPDGLNFMGSIKSNSKTYASIYSVPNARFTKTYNFNSSIKTCQNIKIANQCEFIRLCSPNFNGQFEYTTVANEELSIGKINIDVELKPYQPYIHINPEFNGMYGKDFNDARGLICGGDFSLSQVNSAWASYQLNNKNYQQMFDRQIQNMQIKQSWQRAENIVSSISGVISGAGSGAIAGSFVPGLGTVAGAVTGGVTALAGGITDIIESENLYKETLDYTKDMYNYNLQNIQAQPYNLTKVSSINNNNKIFPIIEVYNCTYTEQRALYNKMKYNGCTINRIATISDFMTNNESYFKGRIIRVNELNDDFHVASALAYEVNKGFFTCKDYIELDEEE